MWPVLSTRQLGAMLVHIHKGNCHSPIIPSVEILMKVLKAGAGTLKVVAITAIARFQCLHIMNRRLSKINPYTYQTVV